MKGMTLSQLRARATDPETSRETIKSMSLSQGTISARIVDALKINGPMTTHDLADLLGESLVSVSPMIAPLRRAGYVVDTGSTINRRSLWAARPEAA